LNLFALSCCSLLHVIATHYLLDMLQVVAVDRDAIFVILFFATGRTHFWILLGGAGILGIWGGAHLFDSHLLR